MGEQVAGAQAGRVEARRPARVGEAAGARVQPARRPARRPVRSGPPSRQVRASRPKLVEDRVPAPLDRRAVLVRDDPRGSSAGCRRGGCADAARSRSRPGRRQRRLRAAGVRHARRTRDHAGGLEAVDEPGDPAAREQDAGGEDAHPQPPARGRGELEQRVVLGQRDAVSGLELLVEAAEQAGVGVQEGAPRAEARVIRGGREPGTGSAAAAFEGARQRGRSSWRRSYRIAHGS